MAAVTQAFRRARFKNRVLRTPLVRARHKGLGAHDAFLASYPRSGTTWLRFLLYETLTGENARFGDIRSAVPSVGKQGNARPVLGGGGRLIQTHERFYDRDRKVVYAVRDARSVVVSEYSWQQRVRVYPGSLDAFVDDFIKGRSNPWGSWGDHIDFWRNSDCAREGHLHQVRYEDLRSDTENVFRGVLDFLEADVEPERVRSAIENNSLQAMRAKEDRAKQEGWRPTVRDDIRFVNTGTKEGWRTKLSAEQATRIEERFGPTMRSLGYL
jgi:Sulfotransferase domain